MLVRLQSEKHEDARYVMRRPGITPTYGILRFKLPYHTSYSIAVGGNAVLDLFAGHTSFLKIAGQASVDGRTNELIMRMLRHPNTSSEAVTCLLDHTAEDSKRLHSSLSLTYALNLVSSPDHCICDVLRHPQHFRRISPTTPMTRRHSSQVGSNVQPLRHGINLICTLLSANIAGCRHELSVMSVATFQPGQHYGQCATLPTLSHSWFISMLRRYHAPCNFNTLSNSKASDVIIDDMFLLLHAHCLTLAAIKRADTVHRGSGFDPSRLLMNMASTSSTCFSNSIFAHSTTHGEVPHAADQDRRVRRLVRSRKVPEKTRLL